MDWVLTTQRTRKESKGISFICITLFVIKDLLPILHNVLNLVIVNHGKK